MPSLWLLEMRRVAQRRLTSSVITNGTNTATFDQFILRMGNDEFDPSQALPYKALIKTVQNKIFFIDRIFFLVISLLVSYKCEFGYKNYGS